MRKHFFLLAAILALILSASSCTKNAPQNGNVNVVAESTPAKPPPSPLTGFDSDLQDIKKGGFTYIYVLFRKDGKTLDSTDSEFIRKNAPQVIDAFTTKDKMKAILGSNFNLEEGNMAELKKRFVVEDYSGR